MVPELKEDLRKLPVREIYDKYLIGQDVWLFLKDKTNKDPSKKYDELKKYIAKKLNIHFNNIAIIGSAKTGVSFSPSKQFKLFDDNSDLDIVLVSEKHYLKFWKAYLDMHYKGVPIPEITNITKSIFKGFISLKNPTKKHDDIIDWVKTVNPFVKDLQLLFNIDREVNYRIYDSWESVENYHFFGINVLKNQVLNNDK